MYIEFGFSHKKIILLTEASDIYYTTWHVGEVYSRIILII